MSGCSVYPGGSCGIYTSVSGSTPNRIFNFEWRGVLFGNNASRTNFEVRIYENAGPLCEIIYGEITGNGASQQWSAGVQANSTCYVQDLCNPGGNPAAWKPIAHLRRQWWKSNAYTCSNADLSTHSDCYADIYAYGYSYRHCDSNCNATATPTSTPTSTPRPSPTARPSPGPRVRPTPAPRP